MNANEEGQADFSDCLHVTLTGIAAEQPVPTFAADAKVTEELVQMAKQFKQAATRAEALGLSEDEVRFYAAPVDNESGARELGDETMKKIARELTENMRQNLSVDWSSGESVRAKLRLTVRRVLRKYKYPPGQEAGAIDLVLRQAESLGEAWV